MSLNILNYYHPVASSRTVSPKLIKCSKANNVVNYSSFNRAVECWNSLSHDTRYCENLKIFKEKLSNTDLSSFLMVF